MRWPCVVVGAGPAGLAMSRCLADRGVDHLVLERREIGDTWATQRWDGFRLNTPAWMNRLLGELPDGSFPGRDEVVTRLWERGAGLPVQSHTPVLSVRGQGGGFSVRTPDREHLADAVVVASGGQNVPRTPALAGALPARVAQLHAADYRCAADLPEGAVLVVGSGQSGSQVAEDLVRAGRRVLLSTSRVGRYRWSYRGRELLGWLVDAGYWAQRPQDLPDRAAMRLPQPIIGSGGHSLGLPDLARAGVVLLGRLQAVDGPLLSFGTGVAEHVAYGDEVAARLEALADAHITAAQLEAPDAEPDPGLGPVQGAEPATVDLSREQVGTVHLVHRVQRRPVLARAAGAGRGRRARAPRRGDSGARAPLPRAAVADLPTVRHPARHARRRGTYGGRTDAPVAPETAAGPAGRGSVANGAGRQPLEPAVSPAGRVRVRGR